MVISQKITRKESKGWTGSRHLFELSTYTLRYQITFNLRQIRNFVLWLALFSIVYLFKRTFMWLVFSQRWALETKVKTRGAQREGEKKEKERERGGVWLGRCWTWTDYKLAVECWSRRAGLRQPAAAVFNKWGNSVKKLYIFFEIHIHQHAVEWSVFIRRS